MGTDEHGDRERWHHYSDDPWDPPVVTEYHPELLPNLTISAVCGGEKKREEEERRGAMHGLQIGFAGEVCLLK